MAQEEGCPISTLQRAPVLMSFILWHFLALYFDYIFSEGNLFFKFFPASVRSGTYQYLSNHQECPVTQVRLASHCSQMVGPE